MAGFLAVLAILGLAILALALSRRARKIATNRSASSGRGTTAWAVPGPEAPRLDAESPSPAVKSCPVCLSQYAPRNRFCVRDGAELTEGRSGGPFAQGMICPTCRRGYPLDASFCPEDADELVPYGLYAAANATRPPIRLDAHKICPECGVRRAPAHLFCGRDGAELVAVN